MASDKCHSQLALWSYHSNRANCLGGPSGRPSGAGGTGLHRCGRGGSHRRQWIFRYWSRQAYPSPHRSQTRTTQAAKRGGPSSPCGGGGGGQLGIGGGQSLGMLSSVSRGTLNPGNSTSQPDSHKDSTTPSGPARPAPPGSAWPTRREGAGCGASGIAWSLCESTHAKSRPHRRLGFLLV